MLVLDKRTSSLTSPLPRPPPRGAAGRPVHPASRRGTERARGERE